jgi:DNA replicative helicase MCM subunit Mcm2 (Cdc46/Mcm family)
MIANNLEIEDDKWEDIEITAEDQDRIDTVAEQDNTKDIIVNSLAADAVKNQHFVKEAVAVWLLGRTEEGNIHTMIFGDPGTGKSEIGKYINNHMPRVVKSVATGVSGVGITAAVSKDKLTGEWVAEAGAMAMADGGFHIMDEIDKLSDSDDISNMNEALSDKTISLDKASIHTEISADVSELAIGNPAGSTLNQHDEAYKQIPIDDSKSDLKDRFDIFLCVKKNDLSDDNQKENEREVVRHMIRRNHGLDDPQTGHGDDDHDAEGEDLEILDEDLLIKYFAYAQQINPELTEDAADQLETVYFGIQGSGDSDGTLWGRRRLMTLKKVAIAFARMHLSDQVTKQHVQQANRFVRRAFKSMDFNIGSDSMSEVSNAESNKRDTVMGAVAEVRERNDDDDLAPIEDVIADLSMEDDAVEEMIEMLKKEGELFEPRDGAVKKV